MVQPFENKSIDAIANRVAGEMGQEAGQLARKVMIGMNGMPEVHNQYARIIEQNRADPAFDDVAATVKVLTDYDAQLSAIAVNFAKLNAMYLGRKTDTQAITAIGEQLAQYTEVGTIDEFKAAIGFARLAVGDATNLLTALEAQRGKNNGLAEKLGRYEFIGTPDQFRNALDNACSDEHKQLAQRLDNLRTTKEEIERELAKHTALGTVDDLRTAKTYQARMLRVAETIRAHKPTYTAIDTKPFEDKIDENNGTA